MEFKFCDDLSISYQILLCSDIYLLFRPTVPCIGPCKYRRGHSEIHRALNLHEKLLCYRKYQQLHYDRRVLVLHLAHNLLSKEQILKFSLFQKQGQTKMLHIWL